MEGTPDYRSDPSLSVEGNGAARDRWETWAGRELVQIMETKEYERVRRDTPLEELDDDVREELGAWAKERSELIGFWISWHFAGGFERLEQAGWHRATIFRKVHRFRAVFGEHPDTYKFGWIRLDLRRGWTDQVRQALVPVGGLPDQS
jgi:hypothetical protein